MIGAREYANLFKTGQYGRLYIESGEHARGKTFFIWVLPSARPLTNHPSREKDTVQVYGIIGGHPGWTETYGWLYHGSWEQEFNDLVERTKVSNLDRIARAAREKSEAEAKEKKRVVDLLSDYDASWNVKQGDATDRSLLCDSKEPISYVHVVPDHCDRIVWRSAYYHLESLSRIENAKKNL